MNDIGTMMVLGSARFRRNPVSTQTGVRGRSSRDRSVRRDQALGGSQEVEAATAPYQYSLSARAGCECIAHALHFTVVPSLRALRTHVATLPTVPTHATITLFPPCLCLLLLTIAIPLPPSPLVNSRAFQ